MSKLLDAIRAEAASLPEPAAGNSPRAEVERYQRFLRRAERCLRLAHERGAGGREVCRARTLAVDLLLCRALEAARLLPTGAGAFPPSCAVVALGGYGRAELCPHSDVDVLFLHDSPNAPSGPRPVCMELLEDAWLYQVLPRAQPVVRTPADCVTTAREDWRSLASLLEARRVWGDPALFRRLQTALREDVLRGRETEFLEHWRREQQRRRDAHGHTPFLQEPHVKNGCGGLRDFQFLLGLAFVHLGSGTLEALTAAGLISAREQAALERAHDFLLRVRTELHFRAGRTSEVLTRSVQPRVARALGFTQASPSLRLERLLQAYYRHVRTVYDLSRLLEERLGARAPAAVSPPQSDGPPGRAAPEEDGFRFVNGTVCAASRRLFEDQPRRLVRAFYHAQRRSLRLDPELAHLIRNHTHLVTRAFRTDPQVLETFVELFKAPGRVGATLRQMHETGLLGALVPAFGRLTGRVQHEFFHRYTVDEHTLVCLDQLDALWENRLPVPALYREIFRQITRPELLYLATWLHDFGKGEGTHHAERGARIAAAMARRLGLSPPDAARVEFLVRHHLTMVVLSQKRDLDDPAVVREFARLVGDAQNLHMLTLLTLADSLGTSETLWNAFKDQLLRMLHQRAEQELIGVGAPTAAARREQLRAALEGRRPGWLAADELAAHCAGLPEHYFQQISLPELLADLETVHAFLAAQVAGQRHPLAPAVRTESQPARGCTVVRVCAWDHTGVFARLAAALSAARLNILGAEIYSRADQLVLDRFYVNDPLSGGPAAPAALDAFQTLAAQALTGEVGLEEILRRIQRQGGPPHAPAAPPIRVSFDNRASATRTLIEVQAPDRVGLLATIAATLAGLGVDVSLARILTTHGMAEDVFYVSEAGGNKILSTARQREIRERLRAALAAGG